MASAVAATSVSEILRPHRKTHSVAEREGFGPWVSPERVGPESSNENHRRYPGGPGVRISLPPARSPLRNLMPTISAQPAEVADPPPKTLSPLQQCAHVRDRVGVAFQAVRILFGLQFNLQSDSVRIVEVEGLAIAPSIISVTARLDA